jgi:phosphoribosyl 1,2-cyclic phosphodiesterase
MNQLLGSEDHALYKQEVRSSFAGHNNNLAVVQGLLEISKTNDRTVAALTHLSMTLDQVPIDEKRRVEIDKSIVLLGNCMAICEIATLYPWCIRDIRLAS